MRKDDTVKECLIVKLYACIFSHGKQQSLSQICFVDTFSKYLNQCLSVFLSSLIFFYRDIHQDTVRTDLDLELWLRLFVIFR